MQRSSKFGCRFEALEDRRVLAATVGLHVPDAAIVEVAVEEGTLDLGAAQSMAIVDQGDFDGNGELDATDIDLLCGQMSSIVGAESEYDLVPDGVINKEDMDMWVHDLKGTEYGDLNLDLTVDEKDGAQMIGHLFSTGTGWAAGNYNCDDVTDGFDFLIWLNARNSTPPRLQDTTPASKTKLSELDDQQSQVVVDDVDQTVETEAEVTVVETEVQEEEAAVVIQPTKREVAARSTSTPIREIADASQQTDPADRLVARSTLRTL